MGKQVAAGFFKRSDDQQAGQKVVMSVGREDDQTIIVP